MEFFGKALAWTLMIGFGLIGVWAGLSILNVAIGVVGYLLGSTLGCFVLALIFIGVYKKLTDDK